MAATKAIQVKATKPCYVGNRRRKVGEVFQAKSTDFSPNCMELLKGTLPNTIKEKYSKKQFGSYDKVKEVELDDEFEDEVDATEPEAVKTKSDLFVDPPSTNDSESETSSESEPSRPSDSQVI